MIVIPTMKKKRTQRSFGGDRFIMFNILIVLMISWVYVYI
jgi:hypothetical protein